jgi:prolipoprotein diacylglyceryl transferase
VSATAGFVLGSIPSPSFDRFELGPLTIHVYGILVALGTVVALTVTTRRYVARGGERAVADGAGTWAIVAGFIGARAAYVSTHLSRFEGEWWKVIAIWEGGIALFGGLAAGALGAVWALRRRGGSLPDFADGAAVGIPLAQAIGRWGNYFNQELFGTPSDLPWAVEIEPALRPAAYTGAPTFHPTFLYESLWNLAVVVPLLVWLDRRRLLPRGALIFVYLVTYGVARFGLELIRTDTTFRLWGLSRNGWVAGLAALTGAAILVRVARRRPLSR